MLAQNLILFELNNRLLYRKGSINTVGREIKKPCAMTRLRRQGFNIFIALPSIPYLARNRIAPNPQQLRGFLAVVVGVFERLTDDHLFKLVLQFEHHRRHLVIQALAHRNAQSSCHVSHPSCPSRLMAQKARSLPTGRSRTRRVNPPH
jgi:hypothetical protein